MPTGSRTKEPPSPSSAGDPDENNIVTVTATINGTSVNKLFVDVFVELQ
jgi:hypothetical protein